MSGLCRRTILLGATALTLAVPAPVAAQGGAVTELGAGYQLLRSEGETIAVGWSADIWCDVAKSIALAGLVSGGHKEIETHSITGISIIDVEADVSIHTFMGGVRLLTRRNPRIVPFAQFLLLAYAARHRFRGQRPSAGRRPRSRPRIHPRSSA
jgi:hypothetical protein